MMDLMFNIGTKSARNDKSREPESTGDRDTDWIQMWVRFFQTQTDIMRGIISSSSMEKGVLDLRIASLGGITRELMITILIRINCT
jgi:hypothetical protein